MNIVCNGDEVCFLSGKWLVDEDFAFNGYGATSWNSTYFGEFICHSSGVYSLYIQQSYMSYRSVDSLRAGWGWKKKDIIRFHLQPYKSGTPKYIVRAKRKYPYWHINWSKYLLFFMCARLDKKQKFLTGNNEILFCFFLFCFTHPTPCELITVSKYWRLVVSSLQYKYKSL